MTTPAEPRCRGCNKTPAEVPFGRISRDEASGKDVCDTCWFRTDPHDNAARRRGYRP